MTTILDAHAAPSSAAQLTDEPERSNSSELPDGVDQILLSELALNGRTTYQELADGVGLSRTAVRTRVQRLMDRGAVRGSGASCTMLCSAPPRSACW